MNNQSLLLTFLVGFGFSFSANATTYDFPVKNMKGGEKILLSVSDAQIIVTGSPGASSLKVSLSDGAQDEDVVQTTSDGQIEIKSKALSSDKWKEKWGPETSPKKHLIEISGATMPLEIHLFDGSVSLMKWDKDALVQMQKGKFTAKSGGGHLTLHLQKGEATLLDHSGKITLDSYAAKILVQGLNGDLDLENFSGESVIEKTKGYLSLNLGSGVTKVLSSQGTLQFENNKGALISQAFNGRIEGKTQDGPVTVQMSEDSEVNVKSQSGKVTVKAISGQGTLLSLLATEGEIYLPSYLKVSRDNSGKSFRGRLRGDAQKGSVVVRSQTGAIVVQ